MTDKVLFAHLRWAAGTHRFALPMIGAGGGHFQHHGVTDPFPRLRRLMAGTWSVADVVDTVRGGLEGGRSFRGDPLKLAEVVDAYVVKRPLAESVPLAKAILLVALFGIPAEMAADPADVDVVAAATEGEAA